MIGFDVLVGLFALFMLVRHGPRAVGVLRGTGQGPRAMGLVSVLNVLLAVAILAVAVKGLVSGLISR
jgi:hypothetical protein